MISSSSFPNYQMSYFKFTANVKVIYPVSTVNFMLKPINISNSESIRYLRDFLVFLTSLKMKKKTLVHWYIVELTLSRNNELSCSHSLSLFSDQQFSEWSQRVGICGGVWQVAKRMNNLELFLMMFDIDHHFSWQPPSNRKRDRRRKIERGGGGGEREIL